MFKKPIERREFYEEALERKLLEHHLTLTKNYCTLKKKYNQFQTQYSMNTAIKNEYCSISTFCNCVIFQMKSNKLLKKK